MPLELQPFDKDDWMGYAGAESFTAQSGLADPTEQCPPLLCGITVDENEGVLVVDDQGATIYLANDDGDWTNQRCFSHGQAATVLALVIARRLHNDTTVKALLAFGFTEI